jgi:hypothetical protein
MKSIFYLFVLCHQLYSISFVVFCVSFYNDVMWKKMFISLSKVTETIVENNWWMALIIFFFLQSDTWRYSSFGWEKYDKKKCTVESSGSFIFFFTFPYNKCRFYRVFFVAKSSYQFPHHKAVNIFIKQFEKKTPLSPWKLLFIIAIKLNWLMFTSEPS